MGPRGHIYGTTYEGGTSDACGVTGCGTVFVLWRPASPTGPWNYDVLHSFTGGTDGAYPLGALIKDKTGALYGTASEGGNFDYGTVFKLSPPASGTGPYKTTMLRAFRTLANGAYPYAGVIWARAVPSTARPTRVAIRVGAVPADSMTPAVAWSSS